jgi:hypothetical protein
MGLALGAWSLAVVIYLTGMRFTAVRLMGRLALTLAVVLFPTALQHVVDMLSCHSISTPADALATLDGGGGSSAADGASSSSGVVEVSVLASNPYFVCWSEGGAHKPAGDLAAATLVLYLISLFPIVFLWLRRDVWLTRALQRAEVARRAQQPGAHPMPTSTTRTKAIGRGTSASRQQPRVAGPRRAGALTVKSRLGALEAGLTTSTNPMFLAQHKMGAAGVSSKSGHYDAVPHTDVQRTQGVAGDANKATETAPPAEPLPDPLLAPFLSDYRPGAWYAKFLDLTLLAILSITEATLTRPLTLSHIATKAAVMGTAAISMAAYVLIVNPFPPADAWKRWVRVGLLCLSASCSILNAAAAVLDLDAAAGTTNPKLETFLTVGSYILFGGVCIVGCMLVGGFIVTLVAGAKEEKRLQREAAGVEEEERRRRKWTAERQQPFAASASAIPPPISGAPATAAMTHDRSSTRAVTSVQRALSAGRSHRSPSRAATVASALQTASRQPPRSSTSPTPAPAVATQNPLGSLAVRNAVLRQSNSPGSGPAHCPPGRVTTTANPLRVARQAGVRAGAVKSGRSSLDGAPRTAGSAWLGDGTQGAVKSGTDVFVGRSQWRAPQQHLAPFFVSDNPLQRASAAAASRESGQVRIAGVRGPPQRHTLADGCSSGDGGSNDTMRLAHHVSAAASARSPAPDGGSVVQLARRRGQGL